MRRLAVIADVHGNLPALEAVIADIAQRRIGDVVNLGDCASGPLWPRETCARLMREPWPTVRGNHDRWVAEGTPHGPSDTHALAELDAAQVRWLGGLAPAVRQDAITLFHATEEDDTRYLLEDVEGGRLVRAAPARVASRLGPSAVGASVLLCGHSHQPHMLKLPDGPLVVNPGSVGCPAYADPDGDPPHISEAGTAHARYAVLALDGSLGATVEMVALPYDHEGAARRAEANGRPDWARALRTGLMG
jgi:predicted phosphodiesterase